MDTGRLNPLLWYETKVWDAASPPPLYRCFLYFQSFAVLFLIIASFSVSHDVNIQIVILQSVDFILM
ncbi:hypothetical protein F7725_001196 [Dissostichus mawsoni]|uniref:Uncharacterized protein n=1 Tax=Dissostichus mawsoni TaxID=36200 RepID=A0A7J5ZIL6_DISMA|nr:hypothetical protein F7725_001196 [Dissostichus mawsoni]